MRISADAAFADRNSAGVTPSPRMPWPADAIERRAIGELIPYARNARTHGEAQVGQIADSIRQWGFTVPVLVDEAGMIIAGHGRVMAAGKLGLAEVPTVVARGWSDEQKRAYTIADNKLTENGGWDLSLLAGELGDIGADLRSLVGFSEDELRKLSIGVPEVEFPDIPEGDRSDFRLITFTLHKDQADLIGEALVAAKAAGPFENSPNPNKNGNALARICEMYLATCQPQKISA
jgi:ParB-like chromosome segregation protein Spo0J